ncbi:fibronectin type III domain-containing protein [Jatrophihabitans fulvus]
MTQPAARRRRPRLVLALVAALGTLGAFGLTAVAAPSARAADDVNAPVLAGTPLASPTVVVATVGGASTQVTVRLTDDASGVVDATLSFRSPEGYTSDVELARTSGTALDGTWTGLVQVSSFDAAGAWAAVELVADDAAGNVLDTTTGLGDGYTIARTADTTAPVFGSVALDGDGSADTTAGDAAVTLTVRARDALSGVAGGDVTFTSPDADDVVTGNLDAEPVGGSVRDGTWTATVVFPARSVEGDWRLTHLSLVDAQGNTLDLDTADTHRVLPTITVRVSSTQDTTGPALTSFAVGPAAVSTAYTRSGTVQAHIGFTDDVSGLATATVVLRSPDGTVLDAEPGTVSFASATERSGTVWTGTVGVPVVTDFSPGTWTVASVTLADRAGNETSVPTSDLGSRASFVVSTAAADTAAPTLSGVAFSPAVLDTRSEPANGAVLVGVADPDAVPSGVGSGTVTLTSPSGGASVVASFGADDLVAGDPSAGTFRASFGLDTNAEDGDWRVTALTVTDVAGHTTTYGADLPVAATLTVLGAGRAPADLPAAPGDVRATVSGTTVTVRWTAASDPTIVRYVVTPHDGSDVPQPFVRVGRTATSAAVTGLPRGTTYTFTVAAVSSAGTGAESEPTAAVVVPLTVPGAPAVGRVSPAGDTAATVAWNAPADDGGSAVTGYVVTPYLDGRARATVRTADTSAVVTGLALGRTYTFRVAAVNAVGTGAASASSSTVTMPSVAGTLSATAPARTASGSLVAVSGRLVRSGTTRALAGRTVRVQYRSGTAAWRTAAASARTNAAGQVTLRLRAYRSVQVRLVAPASPGYLPVTSIARAVTVR